VERDKFVWVKEVGISLEVIALEFAAVWLNLRHARRTKLAKLLQVLACVSAIVILQVNAQIDRERYAAASTQRGRHLHVFLNRIKF